MKKILCLCLLCTFFTSFSAFAQRELPSNVKRFTWGIVGGGNLSSMFYNYVKDGRRIGGQGGLKFDYVHSRRITIQGSALYSQKGGQAHVNVYDSLASTTRSEDLKFNFDYIDIPINITCYLNKRKRGLYLLMGLQNGILVQAKNDAVVYNADGSYSIERENFDNGGDTGSLYRYELGFLGGIGYNVKIFGIRFLQTEFRFLDGLTSSLNINPAWTGQDDEKVANRVWTFRTAFVF